MHLDQMDGIPQRATAPLPEEDLSKLTPRQRLYLENRIQGMPVKVAAAAAGYMADSSRVYKDLEEHPRIKRLMLQATKDALRQITVTRTDVIQGFMDAVNAAQSSMELVAAWREIGKLVGAYEPEVKIVKHIDVTAEKVRNMKDEDLLAMSAMEDYRLPVLIEDAEYVEIDEEGRPIRDDMSIVTSYEADMEADIDE